MKRGAKLEVELFRDLGFVRKKCKHCGSYFWSLNPDAEYCGGQPCVDYTFISAPPCVLSEANRTLIREKFLKFMERNGHTIVKRYPIVARWRDDVYLVGASIYDFQPWVTNGIIPPPANPLTISQPCIRLTDIDNVGRSGRHLTEFEMMAHHAFNYPKKGMLIYWMDRTVELAFRFFVEELKVPKEKIFFKEDWWSGGGNAGECFEVHIDGLEVATLVFMHYVERNGKFEEMENQIVDTGYGLERIVWLCKGTPTVYDAVFQSFIEKLRSTLGIEPLDLELAKKIYAVAGRYDAKELGAMRYYSILAKALGMNENELLNTIGPWENIYILADHSRALIFMLGDGVVPSNMGAGYLARLLIRRAYRSLLRLQADLSLTDVVSLELSEVIREFPEYRELSDTILDMIEEEEKRYKKTLRKGRNLVLRRIQRLKKLGKEAKLAIDDLIEFYDSHGLDPHFVKEIAEKYSVKVEIPEDFYARLAERHQSTKPKEKKSKVELSEDLISNVPPTIPLYYENPKLFTFKAKVLKLIKGKYLILDKTAFYPEGGGQPADTGVIETEDGTKVRVIDVQKVGNVVVHVLDREVKIPEGSLVVGRVDAERRLALMRSHTATHILLGAARRVLGPHVWQAGASKGVERSHLDITHYKGVSRDELNKIELLANKVIRENRHVRVQMLPREVAESKYGFVLYQGGIVPGREIRVVEIENWDVQACGGTHCESTGEIGLIKLIKADRIQDGVIRLEFTVGEYAIKYVQYEEELLRKAAELLRSPVDKVCDAISKLREREKSIRSELEHIKKRYFEIISNNFLSTAVKINEYYVIVRSTDLKRDDAIMLAETIATKEQSAIVVLLGKESENVAYVIVRLGERATKKLSAVSMARSIVKLIRGGAGGDRRFAQGGGPLRLSLEELVKRTAEVVRTCIEM
ncbi:MAG: alanine--tRNA ligase [Thermoprotei archaeon]|nr:MAG: alanine--tRNA ligase [Thermoprotei archaeon]